MQVINTNFPSTVKPICTSHFYFCSVAGNKVASFIELDSDLTRNSAFSTLDNINLSLLTSRLYPEEDVQEVIYWKYLG